MNLSSVSVLSVFCFFFFTEKRVNDKHLGGDINDPAKITKPKKFKKKKRRKEFFPKKKKKNGNINRVTPESGRCVLLYPSVSYNNLSGVVSELCRGEQKRKGKRVKGTP